MKDFLGKELQVDDMVAYVEKKEVTDGQHSWKNTETFTIAKVISFSPHRVKIVEVNEVYEGTNLNLGEWWNRMSEWTPRQIHQSSHGKSMNVLPEKLLIINALL